MIATVFGPSGSERRVYSLLALTALLMPVASVVAMMALPEQSPLLSIQIGCLMAAIAVWGSVMLYGSVGIVARQILSQQQDSPRLDQDATPQDSQGLMETAAA